MLQALGIVLGKVAISMVSSLITESFLKALIVHGMERVVDKTSNTLDNQVLDAAKKAWGYTDEPAEG